MEISRCLVAQELVDSLQPPHTRTRYRNTTEQPDYAVGQIPKASRK